MMDGPCPSRVSRGKRPEGRSRGAPSGKLTIPVLRVRSCLEPSARSAREKRDSRVRGDGGGESELENRFPPRWGNLRPDGGNDEDIVGMRGHRRRSKRDPADNRCSRAENRASRRRSAPRENSTHDRSISTRSSVSIPRGSHRHVATRRAHTLPWNAKSARSGFLSTRSRVKKPRLGAVARETSIGLSRLDADALNRDNDGTHPERPPSRSLRAWHARVRFPNMSRFEVA